MMDVTWVTWLLQFLVGVLLARVWIQLDKNTDALTQLRIDIPTNYETKADHNRDLEQSQKERGGLSEDVHSLRNKMQALAERVAAIK